MRYRPILIFFSLALLVFNSYAGYCSHNKGRNAAKTTLADPAEDNYDIKYLKLKLQITDTSTYVIGDVSTAAQVTAGLMSTYVFELDSVLTIDSAKVNGVLLPYTTAGFKRTITLPTALSSGSFFTAEIFYHGLPPNSGVSFFNGITHDTTAHGTHCVYTVSDPWVAKDWWPAKQSATDKIDSMDMLITVPQGVRDGSNGVLAGVDSASRPGYWTFHWQTHYPIDYYLVSIAVARYTDYKSYWHFSGSGDSMLIQNFFMDTATFNPAYKANFDSIGLIIDYFSSLYGRYPFWREKYGMCFTNLPGGMENQTMTTIGVTDTRTIAHELTHQWFGDNVTYSRWGEMWLSEGFATFGENLFYDHFRGPAQSKILRQNYYAVAMSSNCNQVYVADTSGPATLFNQPSVYYKGMAVVNMLRYIAPADSLFFDVLRTYQQDFSYGNASTNDLKAIAVAKYGMNLDTFFNQWVYGKGYPRYRVSWDQAGSTVIVRLIQTASCPATTPHFSTPLELQLHSSTADTFIKVYNSLDTQVYTFDWAPVMATAYLNPDVWTLCKVTGSIVQDTTLRLLLRAQQIQRQTISVFPNPSNGDWRVENLPANMSLMLTDASGKIIWRGVSGKGSTRVPGGKLATGSYYLTIEDNRADSIKLVHW